MNSNHLNADFKTQDEFQAKFADCCHEVDSSFTKFTLDSKSEDFVELSKKLADDLLQLDRFLDTNKQMLTKYSLTKNQETIKQYRQKLESYQKQKMTKKSFKFSTKTKIETIKSSKNNHQASNDGDTVDFVAPTVDHQQLIGQEKVITQTENETITLLESMSTLRLSYVTNCTVICGPVKSSVFVNDCNNVKVVVACQQLRIHASSNLELYVHVNGKIIIENCTGVHVAPYNLKYEGVEKDFLESQLKMDVNNWDSVDDFDWLISSKPSPNWSLIPTDQIIQNWSLFLPKG